MKISVVVPAYNEATHIQSTLRSIRDQRCDAQVELLVVDNGSDDATAHLAAAQADRVLRYTERQGAAAARQHGARCCTGDVIAFLDADSLLGPGALRLAEASIASGAVAGRAPLKIPHRALGARWTELSVNLWHRFIGPMFIPYLYAERSAFEHVGGWDIDVTLGEEVRLQRKLKALGTLAWDRGTHVLTSPRRYQQEGYFRLGMVGARAMLLGKSQPWLPVRPPALTARVAAAPVRGLGAAQPLRGDSAFAPHPCASGTRLVPSRSTGGGR